MKYEFYHAGEEEQFNFYQVPKELFRGEFAELSNDARLLFAMLRERMLLSRRNGWVDEEYNIFIIYTIENIMEDMQVSKPTAVKYLKQLEKAGLVQKSRTGQGRPNVLYVMNFASPVSENTPSNPHESSEVKNFNFKKSKNLTSKSSKSELQEVKKIDPNNTNTNNTDNSDTDDPSIIPHTSITEDGQMDSILHKKELCLETLKENTGYSYMLIKNRRLDEKLDAGEISLADYEAEHIDMTWIDYILEIMSDMILSRSQKPVMINQEAVPRELVQSRFLKIGMKPVIEIAAKLKYDKSVRNPKRYAISMLYNAKPD